MRAAEYGIRRPDSLLTAYSPFNVQYVPSPSRLLSLMDPLLPTGILSACLGAYAGLGKSPFEECMKTPANSLLINQKKSSSMPVDINKARPNSFLEKLKLDSRLPRSCDASPSKEEGQSLDSFHSCPTSPLHSNTALTNNIHLKPSEPHMNHNHDKERISIPSLENHHHVQPRESTKVVNELKDNHQQCNSNVEEFHSFSDNDGFGMNGTVRHSNVDIDGHHANAHMESNRLLKLNLEDHKEVYIAQQIYDPLGDEYGHTEVQYSRNDDECHVVNVVDPDQSPSGETIIIPVEDPFLRIGTPPLNEVEQLQVNDSGVVKSRSMSQVSLPIAKNPYMSPLVAPDEMLATLPPIDIVVRPMAPHK